MPSSSFHHSNRPTGKEFRDGPFGEMLDGIYKDVDHGFSTVEGAYVPLTAFTALNTILVGSAAGAASALTVGASTIVGRKAAGNVVALTPAETRTILATTTAAHTAELLGAGTVGADRLAAQADGDVNVKRTAQFTYTFAAGTTGEIGAHVCTFAFPAGAVVTRMWYYVAVAPVSGGAATIAFGKNGGLATLFKGATAFNDATFNLASYNDLSKCDGTASKFVEMSTIAVNVTVAAAVVSAGTIKFFAEYVILA